MGSRRKSKKRKIETAETSDEDAGIYTVELILKARVPDGALQKKTGRQWEYYVKWAGYDSDANTWEPAQNLEQCDRLVESFWDDIGRDNEDHPEGTECAPSRKWIATEKKRFWHNLQPHERKKYEKKEAERRAQTQQRKAFEAAGTVPQFSSPEPIESTPPQPKPKKKHKRPRLDLQDSDTSDVPLALHQKSKVKKRRVTQVLASPRDEIPEKVSKTRLKSTDVPTPVASDHELVRNKEQLAASKPPAKGKERAVEEARPDSPSSLFSVDSSDEIMPLSPKPIPAPEPKSSFMTSSSKASSAKPSPTILPKIPRRFTNTRETLIESPVIPANVPSGITANLPSGISTKQRLAQMALAPVNPKEPNKTMPPKISTNPFGNMRFKKQSTIWVQDGSTVESPITQPPELTLNALNASPADQSPSHIFPELHPVDSPISMEPPDSSFIIPQPTPDHVDEFLSSITPLMPGFTAPLEPAPETPREPKPPANLARKASTLPKITKKWKWEKELFILRSNGEEELVGSVVCTNLTQAKMRGMRIHLTFDSMDRLTFLSFHDLSDVPTFLEACKSPDQFGTLSPLDAGSSTKFKVIAHYMAQYEKVVLVPVWYEKNLVGHLMILSPTFGNLLKQLEAPPEITSATDSLIVALHSWKLIPAAYQQEPRLDLSDLIPAKTDLASTIVDGTRAQEGCAFDYVSTLRRNFKFHFAFRALKFPPDLFAWLTSTRRLYAIHHDYEKGESEPIESQMLKVILNECQAQEGKHQDPKKELRLRVVFIHVGSIRTFHRSSLSCKRGASLDIRFYSYGTDSIMPREMWGIREIYPIGGVVTFYPSAFIDEYFGTIKLIRKLHEHPLWMAFISPTCLGYIANHAYKGQDPLSLCTSEGFIYQSLLRLIADGEISLMTAPPLPTAAAETIKSWVRNQCRTTSPLEALSIGTAAVHSTCANQDQNEWLDTVQRAVNCDIVTIQQQPAILYEYRRFVVVKGERDQSKAPNSAETSTLARFNFQDDYFKRKS